MGDPRASLQTEASRAGLRGQPGESTLAQATGTVRCDLASGARSEVENGDVPGAAIEEAVYLPVRSLRQLHDLDS